MRTRLTADWVVGHEAGRHCLIPGGQVVYERDRIVFVGRDFPGEVDESHACGAALIAPGFIDLDALSDLDTTILGVDNQPAWRKGRVWPQTYMDRGPYEMYSAEELAFQKRYAFAQLLRNGITTALPIASLFYRAWGETAEEFTDAADSAAALGLRVYLGPAYRAGNLVVDAAGAIGATFDEPRGLAGLDAAIAFCRGQEGRYGGLVRTMLAPDRIETCTPDLLRRTAAAGRDLDVPVRLHCCQSQMEYELVVARHGLSPPEWLESLGFLSPRAAAARHLGFQLAGHRPAGPRSGHHRRVGRHHRALPAGLGARWPDAGQLRRLSPSWPAHRHGHRHLAAGHGAEHAARPDAVPGDGRRRR
jgi:cytosine/adenosine deaminase-related metal-dependent hydrolase